MTRKTSRRTTRMIRELRAKQQQRVDAIVEGMIRSDLMEATAEYLSRGRALAKADTTKVQREFADAFRAYLNDRSDDSQRRWNDAHAELGLRGVEPDAKLIEAEMKIAIAEINHDREEHPEGNPGVRQAIREYMNKLDKAN